MTSFSLLLREMRYRLVNFALTITAIAVAVASLVAAHQLLSISKQETTVVLERKENELSDKLAYLKNEMRLAMLKLKFNLVILPEGQDVREWHTRGTGSRTMPESYVEQLADSGIVTVRHFLPSLQTRITWPETKRRIVLVGSRGEVPNLHKNPVKPLVQSVPDGTIVLGHELHRSLGLNPGDTVELMGRPFTVHRCHEERGSQDDITAWIPLKDAQELLEKPGRINAILALECLCAGASNVAAVRNDILKILPNSQVFEQGSKALARAEARMKLGEEARKALEAEAAAREALEAKREGTIALVVPVILVACGALIGVLTLFNVRDRMREIAVLRSIGCGPGRVLALILGRPLSAAVPGALGGILLGSVAARLFGHLMAPAEIVASGRQPLSPTHLLVLVAAAFTISGIAAWLPALTALRRDPSDILRES